MSAEQAVVELAHRLGLEGARIWPQAVMITFVNGLFWAIWDPISIALALLGMRKVWSIVKQRAAEKDDFDCEMDWWVAATVIVILGIFALVQLSMWPQRITEVMYPEAATVLNLVKAMKP